MKIDTKLLLSACVVVLLVTLIAKDSTSVLFGFVAAVCALAYDLKLEAGKEKDELTKQLLSLQNQISDLKAKVDALLLSRGSR